MTDIASIGMNTPISHGAAQNNSGEVLDKHDFLMLLVTQLENQDPLNPLNPEEFSAQLAQFSSLEQLTNINRNIQDLSRNFEAMDRMSIMSMLGKDVTLRRNSFVLGDQPVQLGYELDSPASQVTVRVKDSQGKIVSSIEGEELSLGRHFVSLDSKGLSKGEYFFEVEVKRGDETHPGTPLLSIPVTGVEDMKSGGSVVTDSGKYSVDEVLQVRTNSLG